MWSGWLRTVLFTKQCHFRVLFTSIMKACGLRIYPYRKISLLQNFGFGFLSGFVGGIHLTYPVRVWYALASAALAMVNGADSSRKDATRWRPSPLGWRPLLLGARNY